MYRGVILFAMICGRLPFGDDSQVKAQQKLGLIFPPSRPLSSDAKELIRNILTSKVKERFDTYDMILHDWTASLPVRIPPPLSSTPKYTLEVCIPTAREPLPQFVRPPTPMPLNPLLAATHYTHHHMRPLRAGATAGSRLAGAAHHVTSTPLPPLPPHSAQPTTSQAVSAGSNYKPE